MKRSWVKQTALAVYRGLRFSSRVVLVPLRPDLGVPLALRTAFLLPSVAASLVGPELGPLMDLSVGVHTVLKKVKL